MLVNVVVSKESIEYKYKQGVVVGSNTASKPLSKGVVHALHTAQHWC